MNDGALLLERVATTLSELEPFRAEAAGEALARLAKLEVEGDGEVVISLELAPTLSGAEREAVEEATRAAVLSLDGVADCIIEVETGAPVPEARGGHKHHGHDHHGHDHHGHDHHGHDHHGHDHGGAKRAAMKGGEGLPGVERVVAVASGKGGVGKSTVALNLALSLRAKGKRVGLLDADVHGPSLPTLLGVDSVRPSARDGRLEPVVLQGLQVMSLGFLLDSRQPVIWRGPMIAGAIKQLLQDVAWSDLDVLVVDLPPGTGDAQLTLVQTVRVDQAIIVTTPSDLALSDARRGLEMFRAVDVPVMGLVENMSYFVCPHCGDRSDVFGAGGGRRVAEALELELLAEIPLDLSLGQGNDAGRPVTLSAPEGPAGRVFAALAETVASKV